LRGSRFRQAGEACGGGANSAKPRKHAPARNAATACRMMKMVSASALRRHDFLPVRLFCRITR
jgi:hypothetical protein